MQVLSIYIEDTNLLHVSATAGHHTWSAGGASPCAGGGSQAAAAQGSAGNVRAI